MKVDDKMYMPGFFSNVFLVMALLSLAGFVPLARSSQDDVVAPTEAIELFNGKDLANFYTWLVDYKFEDPDKVFTVVDQIDGAPAIRSSGQHFGGLITRRRYTNYHLIAEFRWGSLTWGARKNKTKDSGILLHCQDPEGAYEPNFNGPWMRSVEFQMIQGGTGDIILVRGHSQEGQRLLPSVTATVKQNPKGEYVWDSNGVQRTFDGGRINWYGRDPDWKDELDFRGKQDLEKPYGQWNRLEAFCDGDTLTYFVNGTIANKATRSSLTQGKLLLQSEGAEVFFRRVQLHPLQKQAKESLLHRLSFFGPAFTTQLSTASACGGCLSFPDSSLESQPTHLHPAR
ncbi:MAG TPA: DUF1080 domain-containing protein [Acidobacteriota bacterium]